MSRRRCRTVFGQPVFWAWVAALLMVVWTWAEVAR
jgi:hypothetical protein